LLVYFVEATAKLIVASIDYSLYGFRPFFCAIFNGSGIGSFEDGVTYLPPWNGRTHFLKVFVWCIGV